MPSWPGHENTLAPCLILALNELGHMHNLVPIDMLHLENRNSGHGSWETMLANFTKFPQNYHIDQANFMKEAPDTNRLQGQILIWGKEGASTQALSTEFDSPLMAMLVKRKYRLHFRRQCFSVQRFDSALIKGHV